MIEIIAWDYRECEWTKQTRGLTRDNDEIHTWFVVDDEREWTNDWNRSTIFIKGQIKKVHWLFPFISLLLHKQFNYNEKIVGQGIKKKSMFGLLSFCPMSDFNKIWDVRTHKHKYFIHFLAPSNVDMSLEIRDLRLHRHNHYVHRLIWCE